MWPEPLPVDIVVRGFPLLPPDRPAWCFPWPERALIVDVSSQRPRGGGLTWGAYRLEGPDPERVAGVFYDPRRVGEEAVEGSRQALRGTGLGVLDRDAFLDLVFRSVYKLPMRAAFVCWDLGWVASRLARSVRTVRLGDGSEVFRFVWWTYVDSEGKERTDFYRPRVDVATVEAGRILTRFTRRKSPDPQDLIPEGARTPRSRYVYPGRFLPLSTAVYALTGGEMSLREACRAFEVPFSDDTSPRISEESGENPALVQGKYLPSGLRQEGGCVRDSRHIVARRAGIDSTTRRLDALAALYRAVLREFALLPGPPFLAPDHALSPSSIGKALLRQANVPPPLKRKPRENRRAIAAAMAAYVGPRSEVRVRRVTLPVAYIDAHSMFLAIDVLMRLEELLTHRVSWRRDRTKGDLRALADRLCGIDFQTLLNRPEAWPTLRGLALVAADWDWLPSKAPYSAGDEETTTVSIVASSKEPMWVPFASLVESRLKTGRIPPLLEAYEPVIGERLPGLGKVRVRNGAVIDLTERPSRRTHRDPFEALASERARLKVEGTLTPEARDRVRGLLKVMANSIGYGAEIEFNRRAGIGAFKVWTPKGIVEVDGRSEHPGWLCYPPFATACVAGSRLMMGLLEHLVADAGGELMWMDTDGGCIAVTPQGGLLPCPIGAYRDLAEADCVKALSFAELQAIRERFRHLAEAVGFIPEDPSGVRSIFKLEDHNLGADGTFDGGLECHAVSVKNYVLFRRDSAGNPIPDPRSKFSAHAMGNLVSPVDPEGGDPAWIPQGWLWWIGREEGRELPEPGWLDCLPVMHALVVAHPDDFRRLRRLNAGRSYDEGIMPFDTLLLPHLDGFLAREGDPSQLVAAWNPNPSSWAGLDCRDPASGRGFRLAMRGRTGTYRDWQRKPGSVFVESIRSYLEKHFTHPEPAAVGPDGGPCRRETRGVLLSQPIRIGEQIVVGKDTNRLRERRGGWRSGREERQVFARSDELTEQVLPILADATEGWLRAHGVDPRGLRRVRERRVERTTEELAGRLAKAAMAFAREALEGWGLPVPGSPSGVRAAYLEERRRQGAYRAGPSSCGGCGGSLVGHQRLWCGSCRELPGRKRARLSGRGVGPDGGAKRRRPTKKIKAQRPKATSRPKPPPRDSVSEGPDGVIR